MGSQGGGGAEGEQAEARNQQRPKSRVANRARKQSSEVAKGGMGGKGGLLLTGPIYTHRARQNHHTFDTMTIQSP